MLKKVQLILKSSAAVCLTLLLAAGCAASSDEETLDARCEAPCQSRQAAGCAGDIENCKIVCTASYAAADAEGSCKSEARAVEDCFHSDAVLNLGCSPDYQDKAALCQEELDQRDACRETRDG